MKVKNQDRLDKIRECNNTGVGEKIVDFAIGWADLMEHNMSLGKSVKDTFIVASHEVDKVYKFNGTQVSLALLTLTEVWEHGEELRLAWNEMFGLTEDGFK